MSPSLRLHKIEHPFLFVQYYWQNARYGCQLISLLILKELGTIWDRFRRRNPEFIFCSVKPILKPVVLHVVPSMEIVKRVLFRYLIYIKGLVHIPSNPVLLQLLKNFGLSFSYISVLVT